MVINRNKNRIKIVLKTYSNLQYYFKTIFNDNFKRTKIYFYYIFRLIL